MRPAQHVVVWPDLTQMLSARSYRKYIEFVVLCLLASALLWWFGRNLDWAEVGHALRESDPRLLIAAIVLICSVYVFRAFRWGALLKPLSAARFPDLFAATTIGFSGVFLIGRAGEFVRPVVLSMRDPRVRPSASLVTIVVERIYDMSAVALMFAINLIWFKPPSAVDVSFERVRTAGWILLGATIVGLTRGSRIESTTGRTNSPALPMRKTPLKPIVVAANKSGKLAALSGFNSAPQRKARKRYTEQMSTMATIRRRGSESRSA